MINHFTIICTHIRTYVNRAVHIGICIQLYLGNNSQLLATVQNHSCFSSLETDNIVFSLTLFNNVLYTHFIM